MKPQLFISASMAVFAFVVVGANFAQNDDRFQDSSIHRSPVLTGVHAAEEAGPDSQDWIWE